MTALTPTQKAIENRFCKCVDCLRHAFGIDAHDATIRTLDKIRETQMVMTSVPSRTRPQQHRSRREMPMSAQSRRYYAAKSQWQRQERQWKQEEAERTERRANRPRRNWKFWKRS